MALNKQKHRQRILVITVLLSVLLCTPSCKVQKGNLKFSEQNYIRDEEYDRTFRMLIADTDKISVAFQKDLISKNDMISFTKKLMSDVDLIQQTANGSNPDKVQVYVLDSTITGYVQVANNKVFCSEKDLILPELQRALIQSLLKLSEPWMIYGLQNVIFSDPPDQDVLIEYYSNNNDLKILSLFGAYFFPEFNDPYELSLAEDTAASLIDFILTNYDYQTLVNGVDPRLKAEWLHHLGVDKTFEDPNRNDLQDFSFTRSDKFPVIIRTDNSIYNLIYLKDELSSAHDIQDFILRNITGRRTVLSYLNENISENKDMINNDAFYIYYLGDYKVSHSSDRGEIELDNSTWAHLHEAVHVMIRPDKLMVFEGLANYLSMIIYSDPFIT